jgi:hypothetical protein
MYTMMTVVELESFKRSAKGVLSEQDIETLTLTLAKDPTAGDLIKGTGGFRKVRFALCGKGKSGGARVVYFFYNEGMPLFLARAYVKSKKADLTRAEENDLARLATLLIRTYGG